MGFFLRPRIRFEPRTPNPVLSRQRSRSRPLFVGRRYPALRRRRRVRIRPPVRTLRGFPHERRSVPSDRFRIFRCRGARLRPLSPRDRHVRKRSENPPSRLRRRSLLRRGRYGTLGRRRTPQGRRIRNLEGFPFGKNRPPRAQDRRYGHRIVRDIFFSHAFSRPFPIP